MVKKSFDLRRLIHLIIVAAIFTIAYVADLSIFETVANEFEAKAFLAKYFVLLFTILSISGLCVYYYFTRLSNPEILLRILAWLRILSWACLAAFIFTSALLYLRISLDNTYDNP